MSFRLFKRHDVSETDLKNPQPFGKLIKIRYEASDGSMAFHSEFQIELTEQEIVQCAYWPQDHAESMAQRTHVPVTAAQWADVEESVRVLWPLFREVKSAPAFPLSDVRVLDGGDYRKWFLTRQTQDGLYTAQYYPPDDRRICTLISLLQELAEPIGREIPRYEPPVLRGIYYQNNKARCSYQCTPWGDGEDAYRLIVNDHPQGTGRSLYERVPSDVWDAVLAMLDELQLDRFPNGTSQDTICCTIYFSDGQQRRIVPDRKTAGRIESYFSRLAANVQNRK